MGDMWVLPTGTTRGRRFTNKKICYFPELKSRAEHHFYNHLATSMPICGRGGERLLDKPEGHRIVAAHVGLAAGAGLSLLQ
jgi:hypothetical protein